MIYLDFFKKSITWLVLVAFLVTGVPGAYAQEALILPAAGSRLALSPAFVPPLLKGIKVYRNDPFRLDFILDQGDAVDPGPQLKNESDRLIKYFLASLTVPEKDLWVNLSPYEKDRIVPDAFGQTEMGRDLLAQDYILKQMTASVIYPEGDVGKVFWAKVYAEAQKRYGTTDMPVDTFNKVWIVPEIATVYENRDAAFVVESRLKVMLESDYLAQEQNAGIPMPAEVPHGNVQSHNDTKEILREIVIPILEKEINEGKNFAQLRQVYNSLILAAWYKRKIKKSLMGEAYADKNKTAGVEISDKKEKDRIWAQYVEAFKKGVFDLVKEEKDELSGETVPRKYFSGGVGAYRIGSVLRETSDPSMLPSDSRGRMVIAASFKVADASASSDLSGDDRVMRASAAGYKKYLEAKVRLRWEDLPREAREIIEQADMESLVVMAQNAAGEADYLFEYGFVALRKILTLEEIRAFWPDLVRMTAASREQSGELFHRGLPALKQALGNDLFKAYWPGLTNAVQIAGWYSSVFLQFAFSSVRNIVTAENINEVGESLSGISRLEGGDPGAFYQYALPAIARRIKSVSDLKFWIDRLKQAVRSMDIEQEGLFVGYLDNDRFVDDLQAMKDETASNPFGIARLLLEYAAGRREVLHIFLEPWAFSHAGELTPALSEQIALSFQMTQELKYFFYYISVNSHTRQDTRRKVKDILKALRSRNVFSLHGPVERLLAKGEKRVLIVQNIDDGVGDEQVRVLPILNGLLALNPELNVKIVTGKPDLYNHPRVTVLSIDEVFSAVLKHAIDIQTASYDAVINFYDENLPSYSRSLEMAVRARDKGKIFITTGRGREDTFIFDKVFVEGSEYALSLGLNQARVDSVYEPGFRLLAELGLPVSAGGVVSREGSAMTALPYPVAETRWREAMTALNNEKHTSPVILFSPYGGQSEAKGFSRSEADREELRDIVTEIVKKGNKVVVLANGTSWGTRETAEALQASLPDDVRSEVFVVDPGKDFRLPTYFSAYADLNLMVEGKMAHTAGNIGKPFRVFLKPGASQRRWIPYGQAEHGVVDDISQVLGRLQAQWTARSDRATVMKGGIDLDPDRMNLNMKDPVEPLEFNFTRVQFEALNAASGVSPVIINIIPLEDLRTFLSVP